MGCCCFFFVQYRYTQPLYVLNQKLQASRHLWLVSDLVRSPEHNVSHDVGHHMKLNTYWSDKNQALAPQGAKNHLHVYHV